MAPAENIIRVNIHMPNGEIMDTAYLIGTLRLRYGILPKKHLFVVRNTTGREYYLDFVFRTNQSNEFKTSLEHTGQFNMALGRNQVTFSVFDTSINLLAQSTSSWTTYYKTFRNNLDNNNDNNDDDICNDNGVPFNAGISGMYRDAYQSTEYL